MDSKQARVNIGEVFARQILFDLSHQPVDGRLPFAERVHAKSGESLSKPHH